VERRKAVVYRGLSEMMEVEWDSEQRRVILTHSVAVPVEEGDRVAGGCHHVSHQAGIRGYG